MVERDTAELRELEEKWQARLRDSKLRLDVCRLYVKQMQAAVADIPPTDDGYTYRRALQSERSAVAQYTRTLRIYSDLVVYGRVPAEDNEA